MSSLAYFLRLWWLLFLSFTTVQLAYDQLIFGRLDLRPLALWRFLALPAAQALVFWLVTRRRSLQDSRS